MRLKNHAHAGIFRQNYQPRETIDGAANFLSREQRKDVLEISRQLNIPYIPNLLQSLPAKELYEVQRSGEYRELEERINEETCIREVGKLKRKLGSLISGRLKRMRANQAYDHLPGHEQKIYSRVRFILPERRRLKTTLFEEVPLRSTTDMQVVKDLLALYLREKEVEFRPGLEPTLCFCLRKCHSYDWRHILNCHKASRTEIYGFAELCFLCNVWIYNEKDWESHC
jgi:carbonic anhydrase